MSAGENDSLGPIVITVITACATFGAAMLGLWLRVRLPDHHLSGDSKDVVKLVMGLIATMSALVLGLLIASAKNFYDTQNSELQMLSAHLVELDRVLAHYGPEAMPARTAMHGRVEEALQVVWPQEGARAGRAWAMAVRPAAGGVYEAVEALQPQTEAQHALKGRATSLTARIAETRMMMLEQASNPIAWPFLTILICWGGFLFLGFGLLALRNPTVVVALLVGALALASAAFLILELSDPLGGLIQIPSAPLRDALAQMKGTG